jgi:serine/threonine protein kinase/tetratricopeptide (TPR) repeat protein
MKNVMLAESATIALFGMGFLLLLLLMLLLGATIFLIVHFSRKSRKPSPPSASPVAPATQIIPRQCPQCGAELKPDVSEGLCPACLLQRGIATEGGVPPGTPPFTPPTIPDLARLFPQLEILELIGEGGMGAVYKARQPTLDRFVALKILAPRSGGDLDFAGRFTREARALAKLNHPNIVGVYDFGIVGQASRLSPSEKANERSETGATPVLHYFIMEYVDGPNLRQVEQAGKLSPREALEIIPQICAALQFAHDEGIVHRDIKPENILLDKKGRVKIADFGLAKILGQEPNDFRLTGARDMVGTPHYMAPEQVERPLTVDHRADIYSLGVVFYEMLTGELPLGKFQPPSAKVQIDVRLDEVVLHALEKEPKRRYQQASQVKMAVETIATTSAPGSSGRESAPSESQSLLTSATTTQKTNWWMSPFRSPEMRELAGHLTKKEKIQVRLISGIVAIGSAAIFMLLALGIGALTGLTPMAAIWIAGGLYLIVFLPVLMRLMKRFYCSTTWAKQRGYKSEQFRIISFRGNGFWKNAGALLAVLLLVLILVRGMNDYLFEAFPLLPPFQHYIGQACFPNGDSIEIDTVGRFKNWMIVKGHYILVSHDSAALALYITSTNKNVPKDAKQRMPISKGRGYFELIDSHVVPGLPHVSMYADDKSFAALYFGTKAEALEESKANWITNEMSASAETWSPTNAPGEKPDLQKMLSDAKDLMEKGRYEDALQRHLWYFNHALEYDQGQTGVRLSFALSQWVELGRRYPKAKEALTEIRDRDARRLVEGKGYANLFTDVQAINRELQDEDATYELFKTIREKDPQLAGQCYFWVESLLAAKGEYQWCYDHMGDPQERFDSIQRLFDMERANHQRMAATQQKTRQMIAEMNQKNGWTNAPSFSPPDTSAMLKKSTEDRFVGQVRQLIEILVATDHQADAEKIQAQAISVLDDSRLESAVSDAELKTQKRDTVQTLAEQPPVVVETQPVSGARDMEPGVAEIRVRFSKEMADGGWSWSTAWENSTPETVGQIHYETDQRTCVLKAKLEPGRTYAWWLNSNQFKNFTDLAGRPAVPYLLIFQTKQN